MVWKGPNGGTTRWGLTESLLEANRLTTVSKQAGIIVRDRRRWVHWGRNKAKIEGRSGQDARSAGRSPWTRGQSAKKKVMGVELHIYSVEQVEAVELIKETKDQGNCDIQGSQTQITWGLCCCWGVTLVEVLIKKNFLKLFLININTALYCSANSTTGCFLNRPT